MTSLQVDKKDVKRVLNGLDSLIAGMKFKKPIDQSLRILEKEADLNFAQGGALYQGGGFTRPGGAFANLGRATTRGRPWAQLAPSTQADRRRKGFGAKRPILIRTGRLKRGFQRGSTNEEGKLENRVPYAAVHQYGNRKKNIPARRIIGTTRKSLEAIGLIFANYIADQIKKAF
jgi:phage gpG-like protein